MAPAFTIWGARGSMAVSGPRYLRYGGDTSCYHVEVEPGHHLVIDGGTGPETTQTMHNIETILHACGATLADVVKVNVFLADMSTFGAMNKAYLAIMGDDPPARITVGRAELALGAAVEIDCVAYRKA